MNDDKVLYASARSDQRRPGLEDASQDGGSTPSNEHADPASGTFERDPTRHDSSDDPTMSYLKQLAEEATAYLGFLGATAATPTTVAPEDTGREG